MYFSRSVIASALMGFVAAQTESIVASESLAASGSSSAPGVVATGTPGVAPPAAGMVNTHIVQVGGPNGSLAFYPNNVVAAVGDMVQFQFYPKNHSVAQSTFDNPCIPIQNIQSNRTDAFYSGFMPTDASAIAANQILTYTIRVNSAAPIWFYCSQGQHCQNGMVGAINAPAAGNRTLNSFIQLASSAPENLSPGQAPGTGAGPGGNTPPTPSGPGADGTGESPAEATSNVAASLSSQSFFGLGAAVMAAFALF